MRDDPERTCVCFVCFFHGDLASFIAVQPEFAGSRSKHSETITSGPWKMNHTFVLLFAGFVSAIKVFINLQKPQRVLQRLPSAECVCVEGLCSGWPCVPSNLLPVQSVLQSSVVCIAVSDLHGRTDEEQEVNDEFWKPLSCLVAFLLITSLFEQRAFVNAYCLTAECVRSEQKLIV